MNAIKKLHELGQSIWYDNIERKLLRNGEIARMINAGEIRGVTSNPSIFNNAISNSNDYDDAIQPMAWADWKPEDIFFQLAIEDIQETADLLAPLYEETKQADGFVSLEVSPTLAYDASETIEQAALLWKKVNRKNLMVKIPATKQGLIAIRNTIAAGINVNVTLIFSVIRYSEVIDAYLSGLEDRVSNGLPIDSINSVASFFVSRVDSNIDFKLKKLSEQKEIEDSKADELMGKAAVANSRLAYHLFEEKFSTNRFKLLKAKGARIQRPLWASTSTKNPNYNDVMYVEELIGPLTVNTMPPNTLEAFKDHGSASILLTENLEKSKEILIELENLGINIERVTQQLEDEGVVSFATAFSNLLATIQGRKEIFQNNLGDLKSVVSKRVKAFNDLNIVSRIYDKDPNVWTSKLEDHKEISNRLGWLTAPIFGRSLISKLEKLRDEILAEEFTNVLLLGMGGSSLAAEVLSLSFRGYTDGCSVNILDSTDPRQIKAAEDLSDLDHTLFLVSSKSGSTSEVQAFLSYFYDLAKEKLGKKAGKHFIAITDPGSGLTKQAEDLDFRAIIDADPSVGGRFSALTVFGLLPAVLMGVDLYSFLQTAISISNISQPQNPTGRNPGLVLGSILGEAALNGKDKLTIIAEEPYRSFGSWLEQLIAESSGKNGKGIIPVDIEPFTDLDVYQNDRLFVYIKNDGVFQPIVNELLDQGHVVISRKINSPYDLGAEFFLWEFATSVACSILKVNAFNQPDVQDNKTLTKLKIQEFKNSGSFNESEPLLSFGNASIFGSSNIVLPKSGFIKEAVSNFLELAEPGDYVAVNCFLPRNEENIELLQEFRKFILEKTKCATTLGFGPRFLHSSGQLHKGGPNNGLFIQLTDEPGYDIDIPGEGLKFGELIKAQAFGDYEVLEKRGRRIIRVNLQGASIKDLWQ